MTRGKGVRLLGGKGGQVADIAVFDSAAGLVRIDSAGRRHEIDNWQLFEAKRAQAGRMAPRGFTAKKFDAR
jgi:topoisomerase-4 subunit A